MSDQDAVGPGKAVRTNVNHEWYREQGDGPASTQQTTAAMRTRQRVVPSPSSPVWEPSTSGSELLRQRRSAKARQNQSCSCRSSSRSYTDRCRRPGSTRDPQMLANRSAMCEANSDTPQASAINSPRRHRHREPADWRDRLSPLLPSGATGAVARSSTLISREPGRSHDRSCLHRIMEHGERHGQ